jgi:hypothetical protein
MFRAKAVVQKVLEQSARNGARWRPELPESVKFVAQFEATNSVLVCTLQDRLQADLVVPGQAVLLSVVGVREDCSSLLVDIEEGPRGAMAALPTAIAEVNQYIAAASRLAPLAPPAAPLGPLPPPPPRKRQCFEGGA